MILSYIFCFIMKYVTLRKLNMLWLPFHVVFLILHTLLSYRSSTAYYNMKPQKPKSVKCNVTLSAGALCDRMNNPWRKWERGWESWREGVRVFGRMELMAGNDLYTNHSRNVNVKMSQSFLPGTMHTAKMYLSIFYSMCVGVFL